MFIRDDFDGPTDLWTGFDIYQDNQGLNPGGVTPIYEAGYMFLNPTNLRAGVRYSTFTLPGNFFVELSGFRSWDTQNFPSAELARAWAGPFQMKRADQLTDDPGLYGKSHRIWWGIPTARHTSLDEWTHYPLDLNAVFNWPNDTSKTLLNFLARFQRTGDTIEITHWDGSGFVPFRSYTIEHPDEDVYFEFIALDGSSFTFSATGYEVFTTYSVVTASGAAPLFVSGNDSSIIGSGHVPVAIHGKDVASGVLPISSWGVDSDSGDLPLAILYPSLSIGDGPLFLKAPEPASGLISLNTAGIGFVSGIIPSLIMGHEPLPDDSCPVLDPAAAIQIPQVLIQVYQDNIDALIDQLGKNIKLEFDPIMTICPNCEYDPINRRSRGIYKTDGPVPFSRGKCPYCKGIGFLETPVTECIRGLVGWDQDDDETYAMGLREPTHMVRIKTYLHHVASLVKANSAVINPDTAKTLPVRAKLIRKPVPLGLRESRYCLSFWEVVDG